MIVVYHQNNRISRVVSKENNPIPFDDKATIANGLLVLATQFPDVKIVWCHESCKELLSLEAIDSFFHHQNRIFSYNPNPKNYLGTKIGYVEGSTFIKINKKVSYATWQMSSLVGVLHASLLLEIKNTIKPEANFDYYLNSVAKICMPLGLFCYSEPKLLKVLPKIPFPEASVFTFFRFVKQHYKPIWVFLLFFNWMVYEYKFPIVAFVYSLFYKNRNNTTISLDGIQVHSNNKVIIENTIDVIIPTIGRKNYLLDVLKDLAQQTHLPKNVIIVEQNPQENSISELDYLHTQDWPFAIKHTFTHQAGACNARNLALKQVQSEWVFMADDDIRIAKTFLEEGLKNGYAYGMEAFLFSCLSPSQKKEYNKIHQSPIFGSGCSFVKSCHLKNVAFDPRYEFGYGEDTDFGMQLRNLGVDVVYFPEPAILHLKAPMGGFRTKPFLQWQNDSVQPKPSPTVMLYKLLHLSTEQLCGYKTILFFKFYRVQKILNPLKYYKNFQKQWEQSVFWANFLKDK